MEISGLADRESIKRLLSLELQVEAAGWELLQIS